MKHRFPIGIQSFLELRTRGYVYVDKTAQIARLIDEQKYAILLRPRRFGKSLLLSTLIAYFSGQKDLFEGLAIAEIEKDWIEYPVIHISLNGADYSQPDALREKLDLILSDYESLYGDNPKEKQLSSRLIGVIRRAKAETGRPAVLLVDEYEKPILDTLNLPELQEQHRQTLNGFYGVIKDLDTCLQLVLFVGVTRIGKLSVFSALNNITDLSMDPDYADLCGITERELEETFHDDIAAMAEKLKLPYEGMKARLKREYDGYHFCEEQKNGLYNPYSLLKALAQKKIEHYWFETGTPTFLVQLLKKSARPLGQLEGVTVQKSDLTQINSFINNPLPIIYQSGYLTIAGYDAEFSTYTLDYPNLEVREGFLSSLLPLVVKEEEKSEFDVSHFVRAVRRGDTDAFFERIGTLLASVPYEIKLDYEVHFQNFLYLLFRLMGFYTEVETHTAKGRVDLVLKTDRYIYVMEFKRDSSAEDAMKQIKEKGYAEPYRADGRKLVLVGANFASDMSGLDGVLVEDA